MFYVEGPSIQVAEILRAFGLNVRARGNGKFRSTFVRSMHLAHV